MGRWAGSRRECDRIRDAPQPVTSSRVPYCWRGRSQVSIEERFYVATPRGFEPRITPPKGAVLPKESDLFDELLPNRLPLRWNSVRSAPPEHLTLHCFVLFFSAFNRLCDRKIRTAAGKFIEASRLLNSATSAAKIYRLFAIKCVRNHPRFS